MRLVRIARRSWRELHERSRSGLRILDRFDCLIRAASNELCVAVHHHLWSVEAFLTERGRVDLLPVSPLNGRKRINPTLLVPVVYVLLDRNNLHALERLVGFHLGEKSICRRATRAAFGRKEFDN